MLRRAVALILVSALVSGAGGGPALAAYTRALSPASGATVSGTVEISLGFIADANAKATKVLIKVDGNEYGTKFLQSAQERGVASILLDTTRFADGRHGISFYVFSGATQIGKAYVDVVVKNGARSTPSPAAGDKNKGQVHLKFSNLRDGEHVSGSRLIRLVPDSTAGHGAFVSLYVDKSLKYVSNRAPFEFQLDTTGLSDGPHVVEAEVSTAAQDVIVRNSVRINVENKGTLAGEIARLADDTPNTSARPPAAIAATPALPASKAPDKSLNKASRAPEEPVIAAPAKLSVKRSATPSVVRTPDTEKLPDKPVVTSIPKPASTEPDAQMPEAIDQASPPQEPAGTPPQVAVDAAEPEVSPAATKPVKPEVRWQDYEAKVSDSVITARPSIQPLSTDVPAPAQAPALETPDAKATAPVAPSTSVAIVPTLPKTASIPEKLTKEVSPVSSPADIRRLSRPDTQWSEMQARSVEARIMSRPKLAPSHYEVRDDPRPARTQPTARVNPPKPVAMAMAPPAAAPDYTLSPARSAPETAKMKFLRYDTPQPMLTGGRALVQLRQAVEKLGGHVSWTNHLKQATAVIAGRKLVADMRNQTLKADGRTLESLRMKIVNGRVWIEARKLVQAFPVRVKWNSAERSIQIERKMSQTPKQKTVDRKPVS